jgi:hypothetical protein
MMKAEISLYKKSIEELTEQARQFVDDTNLFPIDWNDFVGIGETESGYYPTDIFSKEGLEFIIESNLDTEIFFDMFEQWMYGINEILNDLYTSRFLNQKRTSVTDYYHERWAEELSFLEKISGHKFGTESFTLFFQNEYFRPINTTETNIFKKNLLNWAIIDEPEIESIIETFFLDETPYFLRLSLAYYLKNIYDSRIKPSKNNSAKFAANLLQRVSFFNYQIHALLSLAHLDGRTATIHVASRRDTIVIKATIINAVLSGILFGIGFSLGFTGLPLIAVSIIRSIGFSDLVQSRNNGLVNELHMIKSHEIFHLLSASQTETKVKVGVVYLTKKS